MYEGGCLLYWSVNVLYSPRAPVLTCWLWVQEAIELGQEEQLTEVSHSKYSGVFCIKRPCLEFVAKETNCWTCASAVMLQKAGHIQLFLAVGTLILCWYCWGLSWRMGWRRLWEDWYQKGEFMGRWNLVLALPMVRSLQKQWELNFRNVHVGWGRGYK